MKKLLCHLLSMVAVLLLSGFDTQTETLNLYIYDQSTSSNYRVEQVEIAHGNKTAVAYAIADSLELPKVNVLRWQERDNSYTVDFSLELRDKYSTDDRAAFLYSFATTIKSNYGLVCKDATVNNYSWFDADKIPHIFCQRLSTRR